MLKFNGWNKGRKIGSGGNGNVFEATRKGKTGALKVLVSSSGDAKERFRREADALRSLEDIDGVITLIDAAEDWFVMELADGDARLWAKTKTPSEQIDAFRALALDLSTVHERGYRHRDIKPQNILAVRNRLVFGDFGLVRDPASTIPGLTTEGRKLGPQNFLPHELLSGSNHNDPKSDVYMLAKSLWVILTGQRWPPPGQQRASDGACNVSSYVDVGGATILHDLIEVSTSNEQQSRPTAVEFASTLEKWQKRDLSVNKLHDSADRILQKFGPQLSETARREKQRSIACNTSTLLRERFYAEFGSATKPLGLRSVGGYSPMSLDRGDYRGWESAIHDVFGNRSVTIRLLVETDKILRSRCSATVASGELQGLSWEGDWVIDCAELRTKEIEDLIANLVDSLEGIAEFALQKSQ